MAKREAHCLVCGRTFTDHDAAPRHFCSVACAARVEQGDVSSAVEGWVYLPKVPTAMWVWNGAHTFTDLEAMQVACCTLSGEKDA